MLSDQAYHFRVNSLGNVPYPGNKCLAQWRQGILCVTTGGGGNKTSSKTYHDCNPLICCWS